MATYNTLQGDTWDLIAWRIWGSSRYTYLLLAANLSHVETYVFSAGVTLEVPEVSAEEAAASNVPPWRRKR